MLVDLDVTLVVGAMVVPLVVAALSRAWRAPRKERAPETMFGGLAVNQDGSPGNQTGRTFSALGPFGLWPSSYSTVWPGRSASMLTPSSKEE